MNKEDDLGRMRSSRQVEGPLFSGTDLFGPMIPVNRSDDSVRDVLSRTFGAFGGGMELPELVESGQLTLLTRGNLQLAAARAPDVKISNVKLNALTHSKCSDALNSCQDVSRTNSSSPKASMQIYPKNSRMELRDCSEVCRQLPLDWNSKCSSNLSFSVPPASDYVGSSNDWPHVTSHHVPLPTEINDTNFPVPTSSDLTLTSAGRRSPQPQGHEDTSGIFTIVQSAEKKSPTTKNCSIGHASSGYDVISVAAAQENMTKDVGPAVSMATSCLSDRTLSNKIPADLKSKIETFDCVADAKSTLNNGSTLENICPLQLKELIAKIQQEIRVRPLVSEIVTPKKDVDSKSKPLTSPIRKTLVPQVTDKNSVQRSSFHQGQSVVTAKNNGRSDRSYVDGDLKLSSSDDDDGVITQGNSRDMVTVNNHGKVGTSVGVSGSVGTGRLASAAEKSDFKVDGSPLLSESSSSESDSSDDDDTTEDSSSSDEGKSSAGMKKPGIDHLEQQQQQNKEKTWAIEHFIPETAQLGGVTLSSDQNVAYPCATYDDNDNDNDCFDPVSLCNDYQVSDLAGDQSRCDVTSNQADSLDESGRISFVDDANGIDRLNPIDSSCKDAAVPTLPDDFSTKSTYSNCSNSFQDHPSFLKFPTPNDVKPDHFGGPTFSNGKPTIIVSLTRSRYSNSIAQRMTSSKRNCAVEETIASCVAENSKQRSTDGFHDVNYGETETLKPSCGETSDYPERKSSFIKNCVQSAFSNERRDSKNSDQIVTVEKPNSVVIKPSGEDQNDLTGQIETIKLCNSSTEKKNSHKVRRNSEKWKTCLDRNTSLENVEATSDKAKHGPYKGKKRTSSQEKSHSNDSKDVAEKEKYRSRKIAKETPFFEESKLEQEKPVSKIVASQNPVSMDSSLKQVKPVSKVNSEEDGQILKEDGLKSGSSSLDPMVEKSNSRRERSSKTERTKLKTSLSSKLKEKSSSDRGRSSSVNEKLNSYNMEKQGSDKENLSCDKQNSSSGRKTNGVKEITSLEQLRRDSINETLKVAQKSSTDGASTKASVSEKSTAKPSNWKPFKRTPTTEDSEPAFKRLCSSESQTDTTESRNSHLGKKTTPKLINGYHLKSEDPIMSSLLHAKGSTSNLRRKRKQEVSNDDENQSKRNQSEIKIEPKVTLLENDVDTVALGDTINGANTNDHVGAIVEHKHMISNGCRGLNAIKSPCHIDAIDKPLDRRKEEIDKNLEKMHEPERLRSAEHYLTEARRLKRKGSSIKSDSLLKLLTYAESLLAFVCHCFALENENHDALRTYKMFQDTLKFCQYVCDSRITECIPHKQKYHILVVSYRLQSIVCLKLYRKIEAAKLKVVLDDYNKNSQQPLQTPSPYSRSSGMGNSGNHLAVSDAMSPVSPRTVPSPAGSVTSVLSAGSGESAANRSSGSGSSDVIIPSRIHSILTTYLNYMNYLIQCHSCWDQATEIIDTRADVSQFYTEMDSKFGSIDMHSSISTVGSYVRRAIQRMRKMTTSGTAVR